MVKKMTALFLSAALALSVLAGCQKKTEEETTASAAESTKESETDTSESESTSGETGTEDPSESETEALEFTAEDYSFGLLDNGFIDGITAADYIDVPDFSKESIDLAKVEPDPQLIEAQISGFMQQFSSQNTERAVEDGDNVNIDYSGSIDGVKFDGGTAEGADVVAGSKQFIDDFLTQIIGHKPGETFDVEVTFPEDYGNEDLAGKDAVFEVTINYISEVPELSDEWVEENLEAVQYYFGQTSIEGAEDIRAFIHDYFYDMNLSEALYGYITDNIEAKEIPDKAYEISKKMTEISLYRSYGVTPEEFVAQGGATEEQMEEAVNNDAVMMLLYQAIAEKEGWSNITEADFEEVTGKKDNQELIDQFGKGYISKFIIYQRAEEYIRSLIRVESAEEE